MFFNSKKKLELPSAETALPGRDAALQISGKHFVNGSSMTAPFPDGYETLVLGLGCFWGAERKFWETEGVYTTAVGYSAGHTPNPTYDEVCSGMTGHNEVVLVVYNPDKVSTEDILKVFWEAHNPTQGMRQGNDVGTQYRSGVYVTSADQKTLAEATKAAYESALKKAGLGAVTTEILDAPVFYYAEEYHQQYLAKNPSGYCGLGGTRVSYPTAAAE